MIIKNWLILPTISPTSLEFWWMTTVDSEILFDNWSILNYLPIFEWQSHTYFDDYGCVSNSLESGAQILTIRQIDSYRKENQDWLKHVFYKNWEPNFSNRDLVVLSWTKPRIGNSGDKVLATAKTSWLIPQTMWEWDPLSRDSEMTELKFYSYQRDIASQEVAAELNRRFEITWEWVARENWKEASKRWVLQVYVNAWHLSNGKYYNPTGTYNHAVLMADYAWTKILDSYRPEIKELETWNHAYYWALKINIKEKTMIKPKMQDNTLVQETEKTWAFGLYLDGKILVGDKGDISLTFYMRNNGDTKGKTRALNQEQWAMFPKYNFKMEKQNG